MTPDGNWEGSWYTWKEGGGGGRDTDQRLIGIKGFRWEPEEQLLKVGIGHGGR